MALPVVLVVDDDASMQDFYRQFFIAVYPGEFQWLLAPDARKALELLEARPPRQIDVIVLDWVLPGPVSGLDLLRRLKTNPLTNPIPVFMVSGRENVNDQVAGLEAGAEDYLVKPFHERQLWARLRSILRRRELTSVPLVIELEDLRLDSGRKRVTIAGKQVYFQPKEFELFAALLRRPNIIHSPTYLWESVWDYESETFDHVLEAKISSIRKKLLPRWAKRLKTHRGSGYSLETNG